MLHSHLSLSFRECCNISPKYISCKVSNYICQPFGQQWWVGTKDVGSIPFSSSCQVHWGATEIRPDTFSCPSAEMIDWRTPNIVHDFYPGCLLLYWKQKRHLFCLLFIFSFCFRFLCPFILLFYMDCFEISSFFRQLT